MMSGPCSALTRDGSRLWRRCVRPPSARRPENAATRALAARHAATLQHGVPPQIAVREYRSHGVQESPLPLSHWPTPGSSPGLLRSKQLNVPNIHGFRRERREFSALELPAAGVLRTPHARSPESPASASLAYPAGGSKALNCPCTTAAGVPVPQAIPPEKR